MAGIKHKATKSTGDKGLATEWNDDHEQTGNHDVQQYQFLNQVIENVVAFPGGAVEGQVIYRSDQHTFYHWNGTRWVSMVGPATVVVAADGSGDTTDIQEGIDQLPAAGGVVYIKEGTYTITARIEITTHNVSLMGTGYSTIITTAGDVDLIYIESVDHIIIADLSLIGSGEGNLLNTGINVLHSNDSRIFRCWLSNCGKKGIEVNDSPNMIISLCDITTASRGAIYVFANSPRCIIQSNTLHATGYNGIELRGNESLISDNLVYDNVRNGIILFNCSNSKVTNNIIYGNDSGLTGSRDGIILEDDSNQNIISNNNCYDNNRNEIRIEDVNCNNNIIMGNICLGVHVAAIVDNGTNTLPNGAMGTNNLALDDHNIIA